MICCGRAHLSNNWLKITLQQTAHLHTETARNPNRTRLIMRVNTNIPSDVFPPRNNPFVPTNIQRVLTHDTAVNAARQLTLDCTNLTVLKNFTEKKIRETNGCLSGRSDCLTLTADCRHIARDNVGVRGRVSATFPLLGSVPRFLPAVIRPADWLPSTDQVTF